MLSFFFIDDIGSDAADFSWNPRFLSKTAVQTTCLCHPCRPSAASKLRRASAGHSRAHRASSCAELFEPPGGPKEGFFKNLILSFIRLMVSVHPESGRARYSPIPGIFWPSQKVIEGSATVSLLDAWRALWDHVGLVGQELGTLLGGSWVVISRVISRVTIAITNIRGAITPLITTYESPSMTRWRVVCCGKFDSRWVWSD